MPSLDVIQPPRLVQKAELSEKELVVTTYCTHLAGSLSHEMIADAEKFLLKCITKHDVDTFDELRFIVYHEKYLEFDIERFLPTSDNIKQHILHAYLQCYILAALCFSGKY